jgi:5-methylcytosine-specific restriction endonuclease McrA
MIKAKIPKALREQVWLKQHGKQYSGKCATNWCENKMTVFDFQCGHDIPESKGGETILENLVPICARCNLSMSNTYTFKEWNQLSKPKTLSKWFQQFVYKGSGSSSCLSNTSQNDKPITLHIPSSVKAHPQN